MTPVCFAHERSDAMLQRREAVVSGVDYNTSLDGSRVVMWCLRMDAAGGDVAWEAGEQC